MIDHEILSMVIQPPPPLIHKGQFSVNDENMCTEHWLTS